MTAREGRIRQEDKSASIDYLKKAAEKSKQLRKVIMRKNMVQYECRSVRKADADEMVKVTVRVYQWVKERLSN